VSSDSNAIRTETIKPAPASSRRKFLKGAAVTAAGATTALAMPQISRAETTVLKMQGSWGAGDIFNDMAKQYVDMVNEMGAGRLKIDYLNAGAVVKAFEVQDAVNKGVLDAGHMVPAYWFGKNRAASLFGTGPCYGWDAHQLLSWFYFGGGDKLYQDLTQNVLGLNVVGFFLMPMPTQPLGWFKFEPKSAADLKNLKYRTVASPPTSCRPWA
jgi:TRAP-type mannitol/chloroaromatic compound transport system substrate-binding protein